MESILAPGTVYASRPVIELDGERALPVEQRLVALEMREREGGLAALELRVMNSALHERGGLDFAFEHSETDVLALGAAIRVAAGDERDPMEIFRGRISALELVYPEDGQPELCVHAEDALMPARMQRRTRLFPAGPLRDIVEDVAVALGLAPMITGLDQRVDAQLQLNESDLAFLRRLLVDHDADLQMVGDELQVSPRAEVQRGEVTLELGSQLVAVRVCADLAHQAVKVTLAAFDVAQGQQLTVASAPGLALGPGTGRTGAEVLERTFGRRDEHLGERAVHDQAEAEAVANAAFARRSRSFVTVQATAEGNPALRVGTRVVLAGLGPRFSNSYYCTAACHRFDRVEGYLVEFAAESAYFGG